MRQLGATVVVVACFLGTGCSRGYVRHFDRVERKVETDFRTLPEAPRCQARFRTSKGGEFLTVRLQQHRRCESTTYELERRVRGREVAMQASTINILIGVLAFLGMGAIVASLDSFSDDPAMDASYDRDMGGCPDEEKNEYDEDYCVTDRDGMVVLAVTVGLGGLIMTGIGLDQTDRLAGQETFQADPWQRRIVDRNVDVCEKQPVVREPIELAGADGARVARMTDDRGMAVFDLSSFRTFAGIRIIGASCVDDSAWIDALPHRPPFACVGVEGDAAFESGIAALERWRTSRSEVDLVKTIECAVAAERTFALESDAQYMRAQAIFALGRAESAYELLYAVYVSPRTPPGLKAHVGPELRALALALAQQMPDSACRFLKAAADLSRTKSDTAEVRRQLRDASCP